MTTDATPRVLGWLGTGRLGAAMARRLVDDGESVAVWNRTKSKTAPLVARGATAVDRITDLGSCDIVFVMVSTPKDLEQVVAGPQGLLSGQQRPGTIVDCSTVSAVTSAAVRAAATEAGVDAPTSSRSPRWPFTQGRGSRVAWSSCVTTCTWA